jgi:transposase-like protein
MFTAPHFQDHDEARKYLEALRWTGEPVCAHCGTIGGHYATKKAGVWRCHSKQCRKDFSVTTKTVMESSHIKLHIWLQAFALMTASKKGMSAHQLHRSLKVTYKSAWFLAHRIREAMRTGGLMPPMGGPGEIVEADETYYGKTQEPRTSKQRLGRPYKKGSRGPRDKRPVLALVERGGRVRSFHVPVANAENVAQIVRDNVHRENASYDR